MTLGNLFVVVVAIVVLWGLRRSWQWKHDLDRCRVTRRDPALFRDQQADVRHAVYSSLQPPAAKGFAGQVDRREQDRQAYALALKDPRR